MILYIIGLTFFALLAIGTPIGFALAVGGVAGFLSLGDPLLQRLVPQRMFAGMSPFVLMAVPFFFLAGELMNKAGITQRIVRFSQLILGGLRGGLAYVNVASCMFFAGITGAGVSDAAAIGSIMIPAMKEDGYHEDFTAALTASASVMGPIIPPSIVMVVYGSLMGISIGALFLGGMIPGVLIGLSLMLVSYLILRKREVTPHTVRFTFREGWDTFKGGCLGLVMPAIILGGILSGIFTPTEASAVAVAYAAFVGFFIFRTLRLRDIPAICIRSAINTGTIFLILGAASILSYFLAMERVPETVAAALSSLTRNKFVLLALINLFLLVVGCFMEPSPAVILLAPILAPAAISMGVDPLQFALIMIINLVIGLITPPVGACLYVISGIARISLEELVLAIWPFLLALVAVLALVTYVPWVALAVPTMFGYR